LAFSSGYHFIDLWRESIVSFKPKGVEYRLLELFSANNDFINTGKIANELNTTLRTVSASVAKLRIKAKKAFGVDEEGFIESSQGEGYKVSKKIKIKKR